MLPPTDTAPKTLGFPELDALEFCRAIFIGRSPEIDVAVDRETAIARLDPGHRRVLKDHGFTIDHRVLAEQIHGQEVAIVTGLSISNAPIPAVDALATSTPGICLAIYVADCAAVYFADPRRRIIALAHSGRKGTELNIVARTIEVLASTFDSDPSDLTVSVGPCIRPPLYEVDFAATIATQARACGVRRFHDAHECTGSDLKSYYSYRMEQGLTGRMVAALEIAA